MTDVKLILIRGLPGSGKSTYAREHLGVAPFEADTFFYDSAGVYKFDARKLKYAHWACFTDAAYSLFHHSTTVVANTFTQWWEMEKYIELAQEFNVPVEIVTLTGSHGSIHGVTPLTIERMRARFESPEVILNKIEQEFPNVVVYSRVL